MEYIISLLLGYMIGCISPSYIISKIKKIDLRRKGTRNLGATNTYITFGRIYGTIVLIFDMLKAFLAVKLAASLFPAFPLAGIITGVAVILGHIFPFYLKFKGGKGVASLGGMVLSLDWKCFLALLFIGVLLAFIFNWGCCISFSASVLFPVIYALKINSLAGFIVLGVGGMCIIYKHMENIRKIKEGREPPVRDFLRQHLLKKKN